MIRPPSTPTLARTALLAGGVAVLVAVAPAALPQVRALFAAGRYDAAREALAAVEDDGPERLEWGRLLTDDPERAYQLALAVARDREAAAALRIRAGLDGAALALAQAQPEAAWQALQPLQALDALSLPGEYYLLAGRIHQVAGRPQQAREMLASVRPDDPAFGAARELLGRIGLQQGDRELALRYFESAGRHLEPGSRPDLLAGQWQALRLLGRDVEAREVATALARDHAGSLADLEVRELLRREREDLDALADTLDTEPPPPSAAPPAGRYAVQLAAFRDRALAMQFAARWQPEIPDLEVLAGQDDLGQPLYRVQTGQFVSRAQAQAEAARIASRHGLEGFVAGSVE